MSLTAADFQEIRAIMREELMPLDGRVVAIENDVKEIYFMIAKMQRGLSVMQRGLSAVAKHVGVTLPR